MGISALASDYGIGDFGPKSYEFVKLMAQTGFKIWQILPLNPLGYGNSPYQPYSSYAMDELYISLDLLKKEKLIKKLEPFSNRKENILYEEVRAFKLPYLKEAYYNFEWNEDYESFLNNNEWLDNWAKFITLKKKNNNKCWNEWEITELTLDDENDVCFEKFLQYILAKQWDKLKNYANNLGIEIMGDIPFYVGLDSDDVYNNQECFLLDDDGRPSFIAGVPPDYFSETGQRWGNPIYDWEYLEKTGFKFWIERLNHTSKMFDIIRIDHFRAFDTYWKINGDCPTAVDGEWCEAPGYDFFETLFNQNKDINIVVEDLGDLRPEVLELRDYYNFKGMNVLQFTFNPKYSSEFKENQIVYTGTHDNQTLRSWFSSNKVSFKNNSKKFFKELKYKYELMNDNFIRYAMDSECDFAIVNYFDLLNKTDRYRINTPGTLGNHNWNIRVLGYDDYRKVKSKYRKMIKKCGRV